MRIGILTYHFSTNYGALMQAYGLRQWLISEGHEASFINYHPAYVEGSTGLRGALDPRQLKSSLKALFLRAAQLRRRLAGNPQQEKQFEQFRREVLGVSSPALQDEREVEAFLNSPEGRFDVLICGSDQIWNPSPPKGLDRSYFLAFDSAAGDARRIAYAPSFGRGALDPRHAEEARRCISKLDAVSVREASGATIVKQLAGITPAVVPDPTILLGDFSALTSRAESISEGHVFCYALRSAQGIREIAELAGETFGQPVLSPDNPHRRWREIGITVHPSPAGWAALIERAGYVVTNSFHGTAFAILMQKPFLVAGLGGARLSLNDRALNLLRAVGLEDRFIPADRIGLARDRLLAPIDWSQVEAALATLQEQGRSYLRRELALAGQPERTRRTG